MTVEHCFRLAAYAFPSHSGSLYVCTSSLVDVPSEVWFGIRCRNMVIWILGTIDYQTSGNVEDMGLSSICWQSIRLRGLFSMTSRSAVLLSSVHIEQ